MIAVVSPYAAAPFANEIGPVRTPAMTALSFVDDARLAADTVAAEFDGWGPRVHTQIRSGSPAQEIIRAAEELDAALIVARRRQPRPQPHDPARQHRVAGAALRTVLGPDLPVACARRAAAQLIDDRLTFRRFRG